MMELFKYCCGVPEKGKSPFYFDNLDILHLELVPSERKLIVKNVYRWKMG